MKTDQLCTKLYITEVTQLGESEDIVFMEIGHRIFGMFK